MTSDMLKKTIENLLRAPAELKNKLPRDLETIRAYGIGKALEENPDFLGRLLAQLRKADAARVLNNVASATGKVADLLWAGIGSRAGQLPAMQSLLAKADRDIHVNVEASDSPSRKERLRAARGCSISRMRIFASWDRRRLSWDYSWGICIWGSATCSFRQPGIPDG
jgi:hypothetical protein